MPTPGREITFAIQVTLTGEEIDSLTREVETQTGKSTVDCLSGIATGLLQDQAGGGLMLDPDSMGQICQAAEKDVLSSEEVIHLVDAGAHRQAGAFNPTIRIDPAYEQLLKDQADMVGVPVGEMLQDCVNMILQKGWLYDFSPGPQPLEFDPADMEFLKETIGRRDLMGTDVVKFVKGLVESPVTS